MKIACQSCQAKYTIADEKVLGRVVKIRCKKCGATIVINGNESADAGGAANEEATQAMPNSRAAFDYAAQSNEEPWTVNVADGDQRTLSTADIVAQFKAGVVNDETYCWRDGMGDWLPLREIDVLVGACGLGGGGEAPPQYSPPAQPQAAYAAPAAMGGGGGGGLGALFGGGDPGAYAAPQAESNGNGAMHPAPLAARRAGGRPGGVDLFGTAAEAGGENDVMTSAPQGAPAMHGGTDSKLTGERNENSVLFSLNALTQNAPKKDDIPGPQGDGSGLIDIRALSANMAPQTKKQNHVDDIMNLGGGGAFSAALAAPVLAPPSADAADVYGGASTEGGKNNKMMFILAGIGVLIVGLLLVVLLRPKGDTAATAAGTTPAATATTAAGATASAAANDTPPPAATGAAQPAANAAAPVGAAPVDPTRSAVASNAGTSSGSGSSTHRSSGGGGAAAPVIPAAPPAERAAPKSFDDALKSAAGGGSGGGAPAAPAESTAPFDRGAAAGALGAVNVASCKRPDGPTGSGHVSVTFSPSGSVSSAVADQPPFAGTPVGGCVAGKFRSAHIPAFGGGSVKVGKSFVIN